MCPPPSEENTTTRATAALVTTTTDYRIPRMSSYISLCVDNDGFISLPPAVTEQLARIEAKLDLLLDPERPLILETLKITPDILQS